MIIINNVFLDTGVITQLQSTLARQDLQCVGDVLRVQCRMFTSNPMSQLTWRVSEREKGILSAPVSVTFDSNNYNDTIAFAHFLRANVTEYEPGNRIISVLEITLVPGIALSFNIGCFNQFNFNRSATLLLWTLGEFYNIP